MPSLPKIDPEKLPRHLAVIMDGNGRWAQQRALPRIAGHQAWSGGRSPDRRDLPGIRRSGIDPLRFFPENWQRPKWEVKALMGLLSQYLRSEIKKLKQNDISLRAIGNLSLLPDKVRELLARAEEQTAGCRAMALNLALSYSGRSEIILGAVRNWSRMSGRERWKPRQSPESLEEHGHTALPIWTC